MEALTFPPSVSSEHAIVTSDAYFSESLIPQLTIKGVPGSFYDLFAGSRTVEAITRASSELKSIDVGFNLVDHSRVQHSPTRDEVRLIRQIYLQIRQFLHIPPFLAFICEQLPEIIPKSIAGLPCYFTL